MKISTDTKLFAQFYRKPAISRIGPNISIGANTLTPEQARETAEELIKLAQEAEVYALEKKQQNSFDDGKALERILSSDDPTPASGNEFYKAIIKPSSFDLNRYGRPCTSNKPLEPKVSEKPAAPRRSGSSIVIDSKVASPKPPSKAVLT